MADQGTSRSSEQRTIRPYNGVDQVQSVLDSVRLRWGPDEVVGGGYTSVSESGYLNDSVLLLLGSNDETAEDWLTDLTHAIPETGLQPEDVDLMLVASSSYLKISEILISQPICDLTAETPKLNLTRGTRPHSFQTPFHGCRISVFLILNNTQAKVRFRPHRKGTWLAKTMFEVKTDVGEIGFNPIPLTPELRRAPEINLPEGTMRYVVPSDPLDPAVGDEDVSVYIDIDLLTASTTNPNSPAARALQHQIFLDAIAAITCEASRDLNQNSDTSLVDIEGSLIDRIIERAGTVGDEKPSDETKQTYLNLIRDEPSRFIALVENWITALKPDLMGSIAGS
jgi:hypothetical protein